MTDEIEKPKTITDKIFNTITESKWVQVGIMFICIGFMYVMMTGGVIRVFGMEIMNTQLDNISCDQHYDAGYDTGYNDAYHDRYTKNNTIDTTRIIK